MADVHQAAFGDRGHLVVSAHEQHPGQDEGGLIGRGVDMQRRPGGGGDSAGDDNGGASRRAGQDDLQCAAVTADGCALLRDDGSHVMALLPPDVHHGGDAGPAAISQPPDDRSDGIRLRVLIA